jgi:hypothetical protein
MSRRRRPNPRAVKIHRSYSVDDIARMLGCHKNTVREWIRRGLPTIDDKRPTLITGLDLSNFLTTERRNRKQRCAAGQLYCVKCRAPQTPAADMADYIPLSGTSGNLQGLCPSCGSLIHRRVSLAHLAAIRGDLDIAFPLGEGRLGDSS